MSLADNARLFYYLNLAVLITAFLLPKFSRFNNGSVTKLRSALVTQSLSDDSDSSCDG